MVRLLADKERLGATELKGSLKIGPGKLYYHLAKLGSLIDQDSDKKYKLSEEGLEALRLMESGETITVRKRSPHLTRFAQLLNNIKTVFIPSYLLAYVYEDPLRHLPEAIVIVSLGGWLAGVAGLEPIMLFYVKKNLPAYVTLVELLATWVIIYITAEIISTAIFKSKGGHLSLLIGTAFSFSPLVIYTAIRIADINMAWGLVEALGGWLLRVAFLMCQGWTFALMTAAVNRAKRIGTERASLVAFS